MNLLDFNLLKILKDHRDFSTRKITEYLSLSSNPVLFPDARSCCKKTIYNRLIQLESQSFLTSTLAISDKGFSRNKVYQLTPLGLKLLIPFEKAPIKSSTHPHPFTSEELAIEITLEELTDLCIDEQIAEGIFQDLAEMPSEYHRGCQLAQQKILQSFCRFLRGKGIRIVETPS